ncbi:MAG: sensor histidine kinase [Blastocatellia bacterium]
MRIKAKWLPLGLLALASLLVAAALLQYRWINRAAEADLLEHRQSLNSALAGVKSEFNAAVQELLPMFRPSPDVPEGVNLQSHLLRLTLQWQTGANRPSLLGAVYLGETVNGESTFSRLDGHDRKPDSKFAPQAWPDELTFYREVLDKRLRMPEGGLPFFPRGVAFELLGTRPLLIFPLVERGGRPEDFRQGPPPPPPPPPRAERPRPPPPPADEPLRSPRRLREVMVPAPADQPPDSPQLRGWCFLELDVEYLKSQLLPGLIERLFGAADASNYLLAVVGGDGPEMIYQSDAALTINALAQVDASTVVLGQETMPPMGSPPERLPANRPRPPRNGDPPRRKDAAARPDENPPPDRVADSAGRAANEFRADASLSDSWRLLARHRAGSLEAQAAQTRRRNLWLNFVIFILLAGSIVLLALAAQRARRLARQQMEFVANITHELRTPLSVIHSASYNLASGVVTEPRRVQDYGAMIQSETRRLSAQVEQALSFAGIEAKGKIYDFRPHRLSDLVERAMQDCAPAFAEAGWQVEYEKDEPPPTVMADATAIESAVKNLLQNALKYADAGKRLRVTVRASRNGKRNEAQINVSDHGPGIDAKDLPHLFKPFYRSAGVQASATPGAGLGLNIAQKHAQAHRGRITVTSNGGARFTIHLPAVDEPVGDNGQIKHSA